MKTKLLLILLIVLQSSLYAEQNQYHVRDLFTCSSFIGYKNFEMNTKGSIVFVGGDINGVPQIFIYKNEQITQVTYADPNEVYVGEYIHINNNDQIIWTQLEIMPDGVNKVLMFADQNLNKKKISQDISAVSNEIIYPSINDNGDVVWIQFSETNPNSFLYLYKNGEIKTIYSGGQTLNFSSINNNGYIVWEAQNIPESDWVNRVYVWDGNKTTMISTPFPDVNSGTRPVIDNQNNVVYMKFADDESGYLVYVMHSLNDNKKYQIDKYIEGSEPHSNMSSMWLQNSKLIFTGLDGQIYLYDKKNLVQLSNNLYQHSPFINGDWMGWIYTTESIEGAIEIRHNNETYYIEETYAWVGLTIADDGRALFAKAGIDDLPLAIAEFSTTSVTKDESSSAELKLSPNPTDGIVNFSIDAKHSQTDIIGNNMLSIYNNMGQCVITKTFQNTGSSSIDLSGFPAGIYYLRAGNITVLIIKK